MSVPRKFVMRSSRSTRILSGIMRALSCRAFSTSQPRHLIIPFVDMKPFYEEDSSLASRQRASYDLVRAFQSVGFAHLLNTPLSLHVDSIMRQSEAFFNQDPKKKDEVATTNHRRGYYTFVGAAGDKDRIESFNVMNDTLSDAQLRKQYDHVILRELNLSDTNDNSSVTPLPQSSSLKLARPKIKVKYTARQPKISGDLIGLTPGENEAGRNAWPQGWDENTTGKDGSSAEAFRNAVMQYYDAASRTATGVIEAVGLWMETEGNVEGATKALLDAHSLNGHTLELKRYPSLLERPRLRVGIEDNNVSRSQTQIGSLGEEVACHALSDLTMRMPVHSDLSTVTLLTQSHDSGGLMLLARDTRDNDTISTAEDREADMRKRTKGDEKGVWVRARAHPGCVLANSGDFLRDFSGGQIRSTLHCVATVPEEEEVERKKNNESDWKKPRYSVVYFHQPDMHARVYVLLTTPPSHQDTQDDQTLGIPIKTNEGEGNDGKEGRSPGYLAGDRYPFS